MLFQPDEIRDLSIRLFELSGAPSDHARLVVDHLVEGSLMGIPSHGVLRIPDYLGRVKAFREGREIPGGSVDPAATPEVVFEDHALTLLDGNGGFGQVATSVATDLAGDLATRYGVATVMVRNQGHVGRLGAYADTLARRGFVALAFCSGPRWAHWVSPFGGREGRFATNPIAYAYPTDDDPVMADFSTSAVTEGRIRYRFKSGLPLPEGVLRDGAGRPTTDPGALYADPPGTIQPLGGADNGHKGAALSLLVDAMSTLLANEDPDDAERIGNNVALIVIKTDPTFAARASRHAAYVRSAAPADPAHPVLLPGDRERMEQAAHPMVEIDDVTFREIREAALEVGLGTPKPV